MLIKRSMNQLSSSTVWRTTSPLSNSAFTKAIHWTRMPDATQNDKIQTHIDSWHYNDTRCLCVQKLDVCDDKRIFYIKKVKYIFTVTHHNDQYSQMNRRGDVCYSNRLITTETYSALCFFGLFVLFLFFLNNNCSYYCGQFVGFCLTLSPIWTS